MKPEEKEPEFLTVEWFKTLDKEHQQYYYSMVVSGALPFLYVSPEQLQGWAEVMGKDTPRNVRVLTYGNRHNVVFDNPVKEVKT
jgi:hypothetical protein